MHQGPAGTLTFLFTDIEGSTRLWEEQPERMRADLARHDAILRAVIEAAAGHVFKTTGDGTLAAFTDPGAAVEAAVAAQAAVSEEMPFRVRMALHSGVAERRDDDYFGPTLNRTARMLGIAHPGQVLLSQATALLVPNVEMRDLGEHRLRDLSQPERVFQLVAAGLASEFPTLRSLDAFATNLPTQTTAFIGRDEELKAVVDLVSEHRLVSLTGVGGVGKTRLALQAGAEMLLRLHDGVFVAELGAVVDPDAVADVVAGVLGVHLGQGHSATDAVLRHLAPRELMLVLDNCEHLIAAVAALAEALVGGCPNVTILATTREPLALNGEHIVPVASLGLPAGDDQVSVQAADAVRLLVDRARMARPDFAATPDNAAAIAQICRRLDGIPLALELAAARLRSMSPSEIASRLDQRFRLLTGGSRSASNRHQTLRRTIDWSYEMLDDDDRRILQRAAVFAGGFDLDAAEAVCAGEGIDAFGVVDVLARLTDKSLLIAEEVGESTRYRMLETVREYALERLEQDQDVAEVRGAHAQHYVRFATAAGEGLRGRDERDWVERFERELENLRVAVIWSIDVGRPDVACDIVVPVALEMLRTDHAVGSWAELVVNAPRATAHAHFAEVAAFASYSAMRRGDMELAATLRETARRAIPQGPESVRALTRVLDAEMIVTMAIDGSEAWARTGLERAAAARAGGDPYEMTRALASCAVALSSTGTDARELATEALEIGRRIGNPSAWCGAALSLGQATAPFDPIAALGALAEAERAGWEGGNDALIDVVNGVRGYVLYAAGDTAAALPVVLDSIEAQLHKGYVSYCLGYLRFISGALATARHDEPAAVLLGYWNARGLESYGDTFEMVDHDAVLALPTRLGTARYEELLAQGATFADAAAAIAFARSAVDAMSGRPTDDHA